MVRCKTCNQAPVDRAKEAKVRLATHLSGEVQVDDKLIPFQKLIVEVLLMTGGENKIGAAPPGPNLRQLQKALDKLMHLRA
jgi:hypothetical protein